MKTTVNMDKTKVQIDKIAADSTRDFFTICCKAKVPYINSNR